jgi:hypothetical protein
MDAKLENIFRCIQCEFWYMRDEQGPWNRCRCCYWGVPIDRDAILKVRQVVVMMARELEELIGSVGSID